MLPSADPPLQHVGSTLRDGWMMDYFHPRRLLSLLLPEWLPTWELLNCYLPMLFIRSRT